MGLILRIWMAIGLASGIRFTTGDAWGRQVLEKTTRFLSQGLGEYQKVIDYYEKALFVFTSVFSNNYHHTKAVKSNLESIKKMNRTHHFGGFWISAMYHRF